MYKDILIYLYDLAQRSLDPSTKNAAAIIDPDKDWPYNIIGTGINDLTDGMENIPNHWEKPLKLKLVEHAERNSIFNCARYGHSTNGKIMVCCWAACTDCSRAILNSGIKELVTHRIPGITHPSWEEEIELGFSILKKGNVKITIIEDKLSPKNEISILRRGEIVYP